MARVGIEPLTIGWQTSTLTTKPWGYLDKRFNPFSSWSSLLLQSWGPVASSAVLTILSICDECITRTPRQSVIHQYIHGCITIQVKTMNTRVIKSWEMLIDFIVKWSTACCTRLCRPASTILLPWTTIIIRRGRCYISRSPVLKLQTVSRPIYLPRKRRGSIGLIASLEVGIYKCLLRRCYCVRCLTTSLGRDATAD